jgi:hypothetical protein
LALFVLAEKAFPIGSRIGAAGGMVFMIVGLAMVLGVRSST